MTPTLPSSLPRLFIKGATLRGFIEKLPSFWALSLRTDSTVGMAPQKTVCLPHNKDLGFGQQQQLAPRKTKAERRS